ncbi:reverse transcriptase family protein [Chryseobacterium aquifrigidense]|uniref:RNA-directed DNA polymerase n=1 Tax=Chryseobacterium aquifrigidense TaxID=558021 RepID=A0A543EG14_9FLAO|nr:reverse transcriptase family protein [Chryseobacterium aquifrigidense]TQM20524.1 RNA-directed DNA polymerase [Chryseobacterium aquifrigidense]
MDYKTYSERFKIEAYNVGYSESSVALCLNYAKILFDKNLPVIYNVTHLSNLTGIKKNYIIQAATVSKHSHAYYRDFSIAKKKKGERRFISEPLPNLKQIQYWILNNILYQVKVSPYAKAYIKNFGLKQNLRFHKNKKKVLNLDIENFFSAIKFEKVEKVFLNLGYSNTVSKTLSKLCTLKEQLPQGSPTSPYLSNIIMMSFDTEVSLFAKNLNISYTRYADDLTFSGDFDENVVEDFIETKLLEIGFTLNRNKKKLMYDSQRQIVTGVVVNKKIQLSKEQRKKLRQIHYYIKRFGIESHLERQKLSKKKYLSKILGQINFGLYLNKQDKNLLEMKACILKYKKEFDL